MAVVDLQVNSRIRGILVKHWIDINLLNISSVKGTVILQGRIRKITAASSREDISEETLMSIEQEIKHIRGVKRILYQLEGWEKEEGKFIKVGVEEKEEKGEKVVEGEEEGNLAEQ